MAKLSQPVAVYLEIGKKRVFASAVDWPGWSRSGRDEETALDSLLAYAPRYKAAIRSARLGYQSPEAVNEFTVTERLTGDSTTDFGAPNITSTADMDPLDDLAPKRSRAVLNACWTTLASVAESAKGKELRKGPRGGGRELESIVDHILGAHYSYLRNIGWKILREDVNSIHAALEKAKEATLDALAVAGAGELPEKGPRGGKLWQPRCFVRRAAWHLLDHVWEIEDRVQP